MPDVDVPRTWPGALQMQFWAGKGPAAPLRGLYTKSIFGSRITWLDQDARTYWAGVVGDTSAGGGGGGGGGREPYPVPVPLPGGPGDSRFCGSCGGPDPGTAFCPSCGNRLR